MNDARLDAAVNWSADGKPQQQENIPIESATARNAKTGTADAKSLDQILQVFTAANGAKGIILEVNHVYAHKYFLQGRSIDALNIGVYLNTLRAIARCKDVQVARLDGGSNIQKVTLNWKGDGFTVERV